MKKIRPPAKPGLRWPWVRRYSAGCVPLHRYPTYSEDVESNSLRQKGAEAGCHARDAVPRDSCYLAGTRSAYWLGATESAGVVRLTFEVAKAAQASDTTHLHLQQARKRRKWEVQPSVARGRPSCG